MSFAQETKRELTLLEAPPCCKKAELAAMVRMNGTVQFGRGRFILDVSTENAAIARRMFTLLKQVFGVPTELLVRRKMRLKKNNVYVVRIPQHAREVLRELGIMTDDVTFVRGISKGLVKKKCCKRAYLRGAFLAGGSVNHPEASSYHLEIFNAYPEHCQELADLANQFRLNARCIERKKGYILYLKESEKIAEFLNIIGAHQALLYFEDVRIFKDMRNSVNRVQNCELANLNKTVNAAMRQIENIRYIEKTIGLDQLPPKLREVAELRLQHPDVNLKELGELLPGKVSKSGINHRLRKINEIAEKLRQREQSASR
ncbi:MAG TPA: DNA-binding protein WhiA [Calditerricola sp.]